MPAFRARTLLMAAAVTVLLLEVFVFNLPHWISLTKPAPSAPSQDLSAGMQRLDDGTARIEDTSQAYFDADAGGNSVEYIHLEPSSSTRYAYTVSNDTATRIDVLPAGSDEWITGSVDSFCYRVDSSTYLKNRTGYAGPVSTVRVWFQEAKGSRIPVSSVIVNARVPFQPSIQRMAFMMAVMILLIALRPRSRLHRVSLDTRNTRQRIGFWMLIGLPCAAAFTWALAGNGLVQTPAFFHHSNSYAYDFNQFQQTADAILHGHAYLDLYVSPQLLAADNPYDAGTRETLLSRGAYPIFWDHVLYNGHYYSYFGVVPVILLFLPFQAITSLWTDDGLMLSTITSGAFMLCLAVLFGALATVRFVERHFPGASVASVMLCFVLLFSGSTIMAPICRVDFYTIPFCAGLCTAAIGLYLWQGALRVADPALGRTRKGRERTRVWTVADRECDATSIRVSLPRLFFGSFFMICILGCRPPLAALCILLVPMVIQIAQQLTRRALAKQEASAGAPAATPTATGPAPSPARKRRQPAGTKDVIAAAVACAIPVCLVLAGLGYWNAIRFGSPLDFGNDYQLTVVDLKNYHEPLNVLAQIVFYYLFLPLSFTTEFPFLTSTQTALSSWQCYEPIIGGMFFMTPLLAIGLAFPFLHRKLREHDGWLTCWLCAVTGTLMLLFISYKGGLLWRYKIDFTIYMSVIAMFVLMLVLQWARAREYRGWAKVALVVMLVATVASGILCLQSVFVRNVSYPLVTDQPGIFHTVRSWFQLLV